MTAADITAPALGFPAETTEALEEAQRWLTALLSVGIEDADWGQLTEAVYRLGIAKVEIEASLNVRTGINPLDLRSPAESLTDAGLDRGRRLPQD